MFPWDFNLQENSLMRLIGLDSQKHDVLNEVFVWGDRPYTTRAKEKHPNHRTRVTTVH